MNWYKIAKKECSGWVAVRLPKMPSNKILKWGKENIPNGALCKEEGKGRDSDTHITIIYGVCDNSMEIVEEIVKKYKTIDVTLGKVSSFVKSPDFDVVKIGIISEDLRRLHEDIKRKLEVTESFNKYQPHCTIAYVKKGEALQFVGDDFIEGTKVSFDKVVFINDKDEEFEIKL